MRTMVRLFAVAVVAGLLISGAAHAASDTAVSVTEQKKAAVVDVGNKVCPVTGEPVDGKTFYEYNGKRYGFCCSGCIATFKSDPEKFSAIAGKEAAGNK